jgi:hypothetical protein
MGRSYEITLKVSKRRDIEILEHLAKYLNRGTAGQRAARTRRKKIAKK